MTTMRSLYQWFAASALHSRDATALEVAGHTLSYRDLDQLAGRLGEELVASCGEVPKTIGVLGNRTVAAYVGYLAAQRLGRPVIPLNPSFPAEFNKQVVADGGIDAVIAAQPAPDLDVPVLVADDILLDRCRTGNPPPPAPSGSDVAYVLFTSGSTGAPKGVPIGQANVSAYLDHIVPRYELGPGSRVSQTFDLTFDLSVFDLFAAWGSGGCVVVPGRAELIAPMRFVTEQRITHWFSVPSVVSMARRLGRLSDGGMPALRWSLFCGEPLTIEAASAWQAAAPNSALENLYGPTELTLSCAQYRFPADPRQRPETSNGTVPIGDIHPGHESIVVDENGQAAREGELCVRGPQRFGGYLDPEDNSGRFVEFSGDRAHPTSGAPTQRSWFRTGDLVRHTESGLLHLGRLDYQVKVQGYRVELGEIEFAMRTQDGVDDAVVVALTLPGGHVVLAGVYTGPAEDDAILAALRGRLPGHLVPRSVARWAEFPLNPNGKVDRQRITALLGN